MKKKLIAIISLLIVSILCSVCFVACGEKESKVDPEIYAIYEMYSANAKEKGEMPLTYDDWLKSIKGEKGDKGDQGDKGNTPLLRINGQTGYWEVSYDNGITFNSLGVLAVDNKPKEYVFVEINSNGGKFYDGDSIKEFFVQKNSAINMPLIPERDGYLFMGWDYDFKNAITSNLAISAQWEAIFEVANNTIIGLTNKGKELKEIEIPNYIDGVKIEKIGDHAFYNNTLLNKATLNINLTDIGEYAFAGCSNISNIIYNGTKAEFKKISRGKEWNSGVNIEYYVECIDGKYYYTDDVPWGSGW